jgi:hypothetical protein
MRSTNAQLAAHLARARQEAEREVGALRGELSALAGRFKAEQVSGSTNRLLHRPQSRRHPPLYLALCSAQGCSRWHKHGPSRHRQSALTLLPLLHPMPAQERLATLRERLAEECRGRAELEAAHQERVKDLHKRLQAEHLLRRVQRHHAG